MGSRAPYRWVIRSYPAPYRRRYGAELIDTALAMHGGRWSAREAAALLAHGLRVSARTPGRLWGLALVAPAVAFGTQLGWSLWAPVSDGPTPAWVEVAQLGTVVLTWLSSASLVSLLVLAARHVRDRPARWRTATAAWAATGLGLLAAVVVRIGPISAAVDSASYRRLWPTRHPVDPFHLTYGVGWSPGAIVTREAIVIVVLAVGTGLILRLLGARGSAGAAAGAVALGALVLFGYVALTPWSFRMDYDLFVGDAVLGASAIQLVLPVDPVGGLAVLVAAAVTSGLILSWGGARYPDPVTESPARRTAPGPAGAPAPS